MAKSPRIMIASLTSKNDKSRNKAEQLRAAYQREPALHQKILQIKALLFHMQRKGDFVSGLARSSLRAPDNKKFNAANLNPILERLLEKKLLTKDFNCAPSVLHAIAADAVKKENADFILSTLKHFYGYTQNYEPALKGSFFNTRAIHVAVHLNKLQPFLNDGNAKPEQCEVLFRHLHAAFYAYFLDPAWMKSRHPVIQLYLLSVKLCGFYANIPAWPPDLLQWIRLVIDNDCIDMAIKHKLDGVPLLMSRLLLLSLAFNKLAELKQHLPHFSDKHYFRFEIQGALAFLNDNKKNAIQYYEQANKLFKVLSNKDEWLSANLHGIFYVLALLQQAPDFKKAIIAIASLRAIRMHDALPAILETLLYLKRLDHAGAVTYYKDARHQMECAPTVFPLVQGLLDWTAVLLTPEDAGKLTQSAQEKFKLYHDFSHPLVAQLYLELIEIQNEKDEKVRYFFDELFPLGQFRFMNLVPIKRAWEYAVDQLRQILIDKDDPASTLAVVRDRRLVWLVDPKSQQIEVAEQTLAKNGLWSAGRAIALKRLHDHDPKLDYLTPHDRLAIRSLRRKTFGWQSQEHFFWDQQETLTALIGHPLVFHGENRQIPIELVKGEIELQIEKTGRGYHFTLSKYSTVPTVFLESETANRYRVITLTEEAVSIGKILSKEGMTVPFEAKAQVIEMICHAKNAIQIQSDVADEELPIIAGDSTPRVQLLPVPGGLNVNLWIRPLGEEGAYYAAAQGTRSFIAKRTTAEGEVKNKVVRNFEEEQQNIQAVINQCGTLAQCDQQTNEWHFDEIEQSLELLQELDLYKKDQALIIEWPKGQALKVKKTLSAKNLSLSIKGSGYWFEYEGEINIDDEQVLDIKKLLDLLGQSRGRFIPLANGEFIALTERFKRQLDDLRARSESNKIYHLGTSCLQELAEEVGVLQEDQAWTAHLEELKAMEKHPVVVPPTLQAELREYQMAGFTYLSRLAHWKIGVCLADDMGLGKTVQAIALLLEHAPEGPCLVVAPTSVCFVWQEELAKFAPTLKAHTFYSAEDREVLIKQLGKMDILICSYGLLLSSEYLLEKAWQMTILDEAQAIKNSGTKRWKCVTRLNSRCRVALTGTPIENHLGELWSIFRFLNPGLLGSLAFFQERFSDPIERFHDPIAQRALKNLISPYILRRTKSEVLLELPPKIEQHILIEPTAEEMAFYEAVRIKALERIQQIDAENKNKRFSILAEISRLRQACCDASLVDEQIVITSSKLKTFLMLVKNLIDNQHKVLIFSQYVRYLSKIKTVLEQEAIIYQYLDGTTTMKERQRVVEAFQAGEGDLFLISLKAGGTGLNLTAADYVIILDPWWNPAVEDQAADSAHRMGQLRPVTVYRLIMKNSIEEKIVALHKDKKDLAADLLNGSDLSGKLSEEALVGLITG